MSIKSRIEKLERRLDQHSRPGVEILIDWLDGKGPQPIIVPEDVPNIIERIYGDQQGDATKCNEMQRQKGVEPGATR